MDTTAFPYGLDIPTDSCAIRPFSCCDKAFRLAPQTRRPAVNRLRSSPTRPDRNLAFRSSAVLFVGAALAVGGCTGQASDPPADSDAPQASVASASEANVIRELVAGDRGCYVRFDDVQGRSSEGVASYELCERTELVGQRVQFRRERTPIQAMSCEGDPDCVHQDTVDLIVAADKLP